MKTVALTASVLVACLALGSRAPASEALRDRGLAVVLDAATGRVLATIPTNGYIDAAAPDGKGGWFVGGSFTRVRGSLRIGLAHLLANGRIDRRWHAWIGGASGRLGSVLGLAREGSRLFVAGAFGRIDGVTRPGLGAVDTRTSALVREWSPVPPVWIDVQDLAVAGGRLLVVGSFGLKALDLDTGAPDGRWQSGVEPIPDAGFLSLVPAGSRVYVAGAFHVRGLRRNGLVALDARTGTPDGVWAPHVPNCSSCIGFGVVYGLAPSPTRIYVSGDFREIGGVARNGVAAFDPRVGRLDRGWTPASGGTRVYALAPVGSRLYLGGATGLVALDARTGARIPLRQSSLPAEVDHLFVSGGRILAAGPR